MRKSRLRDSYWWFYSLSFISSKSETWAQVSSIAETRHLGPAALGPRCFCAGSAVCGRTCSRRVDLTGIPRRFSLHSSSLHFHLPTLYYGLKNLPFPQRTSLLIKSSVYKHVYKKCSLIISASCMLFAPQHSCQLSPLPPTSEGWHRHTPTGPGLPWQPSPKEARARSRT